MTRARQAVATATAVGAALALTATGVAYADNGTNTTSLRGAVTADGISAHLTALQAIADANNDNRAAGTNGHVESAAYIEAQLTAAGYSPVRQTFTYDQFILNGEALESESPPVGPLSGYSTMSYSGSGDVTAEVQEVDINLDGDRASTSGCEAADFAGFTPGNIALIQRGSCTFRLKADNAIAAGASGVLIFNQGNDNPNDDRFGVVFGTLDPPQVSVPVMGTSFELGQGLAQDGVAYVRMMVDADLLTTETYNILADTAGRTDRTVVVGAHLDSVAEGPGINDNGSGSAAILETAIQMSELGITPKNRVRFAFWSGEEDGLIGSSYYVQQLSARDIKNHAVNLNFDMVASPNFVRFVYDGDGSAFGTDGPNGSGLVEKVFADYFSSQGLATAPTEFDGRSDYFEFIENGIPAGGLFTGAEGIKSAEEAGRFGGTAGQAYDPCYHAACDTIANINDTALEQMADAIAHSTLTFAQTTSAINGTARGSNSSAGELSYKGTKAIR